MAPVDQPYSDAYLAESRQANIYAACLITLLFSFIAVVLRFWCRWVKSAGFKLDDYLIIVGELANIGVTSNTVYMTYHGLGRHIQALGPRATLYLWRGWFIAEVQYTAVIVSVKFSILALYWRTFAPLNIKWEIVIVSVLVLLWGLSVYICMMLHCVPLRKYWLPDTPGECNLDNQAYFLAISIPNILIDVALLVLPVRYIMRLQMGRIQKQTVAALFLFGGFVCIASLMRLISVAEANVADPDSTWVNVGQATWATVETNFAVICACLPCLGPIITHFWPSALSTQHSPSAQGLNNQWTIGSEPRNKFTSNRSKGPFTETLLLSKDGDTQLETFEVPEDRVKVKSEWTVVETDRTTLGSNSETPWERGV
ncbi:hypothetical protein DOTSEDRAFT_37327 [Dothistroma septosporum NZE10]|uniref:Rhodopsin domain-containing protein n=1 Tax=Dothistroma septosporum (strain NZE10 / CBS 128990) TaxID=675120 RepID=N1PG06_DOTSN|nr:hypothetical protein DOTSEDRAFT_37327 [Dothistroma septosporum NZE10]